MAHLESLKNAPIRPRPFSPAVESSDSHGAKRPTERKTMRIGLSTSVIQGGKSGVAQYVFGLLRALFALHPESQPEYVLYVLERDLAMFDFARGKAELVSVPERFRAPVKNILWHQSILPRLARRNRLDVLHVPSYRRMLWRSPCPLVATIHDVAPFQLAGKYEWKRMLYGRLLVPWLARRQKTIIAVSRHTARDVAAFLRVPEGRIASISNGIDHGRFFPGDRDEACQALARSRGLERPFFLYVARLEHPGKNHVRLISAFEMFKAATHSNWQLVFGGSDWHGAEAIHAALARSPCAPDIRCLGFVPDDELPNLYRAAEVFVYPSLFEGFGLPPLEAMACGCPVISSTRGALAEVVADAAAVIEPEDIHSIARQLYVLATDNGVKNRLRAAGLARANEFDWARTAAETLKVYEAARNL